MLEAQPEDFQIFLKRCSVYRLPVLTDGIGSLVSDLPDWESHLETAVRLSLIEKDSTRTDPRYWVTPLLREDLFEELDRGMRTTCHQTAVAYYQNILERAYDLISIAELIWQALSGGLTDIAVAESASRFLPYLHESLAYNEALEHGKYICFYIPEIKRNDAFSIFMFELGRIYSDIGKSIQAIEYYEEALSINREVYGDCHPNKAAILNNIGLT